MEDKGRLGLVLFLFEVSRWVKLLTKILITDGLLLMKFLFVFIEVDFELFEYIFGRHVVIETLPT